MKNKTGILVLAAVVAMVIIIPSVSATNSTNTNSTNINSTVTNATQVDVILNSTMPQLGERSSLTLNDKTIVPNPLTASLPRSDSTLVDQYVLNAILPKAFVHTQLHLAYPPQGIAAAYLPVEIEHNPYIFSELIITSEEYWMNLCNPAGHCDVVRTLCHGKLNMTTLEWHQVIQDIPTCKVENGIASIEFNADNTSVGTYKIRAVHKVTIPERELNGYDIVRDSPYFVVFPPTSP